MPATHATRLSRTHRILIGVVVAGAALIAAIGFAGSYTAVRDLAERKGFGAFSAVFPIGIDAGIVVLLALFPVKFFCSISVTITDATTAAMKSMTYVSQNRRGRRAIAAP
ncbi:hypothetical protein SRIMHP_19045 [Streptomyces rimosus subsp. rimosus]|uniref:DUF2637 domain-containing protein n=1 Tax=Streptomyces rimosus subsp. rimosus TaxID=132474 RepID=A0ABY3Z399_STRRM|nr:hypothetical protein SRIMR7_21600 [Streptomyces rimosus subsp. rimosus]UTH96221.1 hypothetical protein SRIMHP_19045 [Streptomyces rimosus subsp. rimosus]UTJ14318.1 hypothetical protein SRIMDV3_18940 [Streptomyces rimosus subsp. rimosus]